MDVYEPYIALAVAFGVGLLIGLQREQHAAEDENHEHTFLGGVRTFPLYALAGGNRAVLVVTPANRNQMPEGSQKPREYFITAGEDTGCMIYVRK